MSHSIRSSELRDRYDSIVIGAGIGGLVCGGFLNQSGSSTLVLDQHYLPGGYCTAFPRKKYVFDAAVHHIGGCGRYGIVGQVVSKLGVKTDLVRLDPMDHLIFPDFELRIPADLDEYQAELALRFPEEKEQIPRFFRDLVRLYRQVLNRKRGGELVDRYRRSTYQGFLQDYFSDPGLMRVLAGQWGYLGSPAHEISAIGMCQMLVNYLKDGAYYPIGSTQAFSNAVVDALLAAGCHVRLRERVTEVLIDDSPDGDGYRAAGVRLEDGRTIRADTVVSAVDARQLFCDLLPEETCREERRRIQELRAGPSFYGFYAAFSRDVDLSPLPRGFFHFPEDHGAIDWIYLSVTTDVDPGLAPPDEQIISATVGVRPESPAFTRWQDEKSEMAQAVMAYLDQRVPGIAGHLTFLEAASPRTLARYTLSKDGVAYGWAVIPDQAGNDRFSQHTSVEGLWLAGQWTPPGPGVCAVAASGWMAANRIREAGIRETAQEGRAV